MNEFIEGPDNVSEWQELRVQFDDPVFTGGANDLAVNDYKVEWMKKNPAK